MLNKKTNEFCFESCELLIKCSIFFVFLLSFFMFRFYFVKEKKNNVGKINNIKFSDKTDSIIQPKEVELPNFEIDNEQKEGIKYTRNSNKESCTW